MGPIRIGDKVNLFNVLHVPDLDINLLSVNKVLQQNFNILCAGVGRTIKQGNKNIIEAFRVGNLFRIQGKARKRTIFYSDALSRPVSVTPQPADSPPDLPASRSPLVGAQPLILWHQRLGHLNYYNLCCLLSLADGIPITKSQKF